MLVNWSTVTSVAIYRDHLRSWLNVLGDSTTVDWNTLQLHQALSNLSVRGGINLAAFGISKELVQGIVIALSVVIGGMLTNVSSVRDWIVHWTVGACLLGSVIAVVGGMVWLAILNGTGMHLGAVVIITSAISFTTTISRALPTMSMLFGGSQEDRVIGMCLDMFLQILRALERLSAEVTFVRLERDMDTNVRCDMVALDGGGSALVPSASEVQVVGTLAADMLFANVLEEGFSRSASL